MKLQHGGARQGAGRRRLYRDKSKITVVLERAERDYLRTEARERGVAVSTLVRFWLQDRIAP